jgi:hypothetical protein
MLELLISLSYIAFGVLLFAIDIKYNISRFLTTGCFDDGGFGLMLCIYIVFSPIVLLSMIWNTIINFFNYIFKNK